MTKPQRAIYNGITQALKRSETDLTDVGYLYILPSPFEKGWFKFGYTKNLANRLSLYNSSTTTNAFVYRYTSTELYNVNNLEQAILESLRLRRVLNRKAEWFKIKTGSAAVVPTLIAVIEEISNVYNN